MTSPREEAAAVTGQEEAPRWAKITCEEREALVCLNGARYEGLGVAAGRTDLSGQYGEATIFTEWYDKATDRSILRDYRYPHPRAVGQPITEPRLPDVKPCEHFKAVSDDLT